MCLPSPEATRESREARAMKDSSLSFVHDIAGYALLCSVACVIAAISTTVFVGFPFIHR